MFIWIKFAIPVCFSSLVPKVSLFTLSIFCLTMFSLSWFMDLTFHIFRQYCSLHHQTLLSPPDTSTAEHHFRCGPTTSFFLELLVSAPYSSPVAYWTPSNLGGLSFGVISFCLFILFMGFSRQEYWGGLPFYPPVDHILLELFSMTHSSWVALHGVACGFIKLHKPLCHYNAVNGTLKLDDNDFLLWSCRCYCCSIAKLCPTLCDPMDCSTPGFHPSLSLRVCSNLCPLSQWCHPTTRCSITIFF